MSIQRIKEYLDRHLTVAELIEKLKDQDPEAKVVFSYNYGDYWRTQVGAGASRVEAMDVSWCDRLEMPELVDGDDDRDSDNVVVIS